jgi:hypothetical protein
MHRTIGHWIVAAAAVFWGARDGWAEPREFTSADGRKLSAEIVGYADGEVRLKLGNGSTAAVPLLNLSETDREYVDLWATDPARTAEAAVSASDGGSLDSYLGALGYAAVTYNDEKFAMIVPVTIAGQPYQFIVNTGLPYSYLDGPMADVLNLTVKQLPDVLAGPDGPVPIGETRLDDFRIGEESLAGRTFRVANLAGTGLNNTGTKVDGVLGFDFLMECRAILDYKTKKIYLKASLPR